MLFDKYQYREYNVKTRGYSKNVEARNESGATFWVKLLMGIEKNDTKSKILADKM